MTNIRIFASLIIILGTCGNFPLAFAHHSEAPHFDADIELIIENASIVEWKFVNPHSYLYFDVASDDGDATNWRCESSAATMLKRNGWTDETLARGELVTIVGSPARREANVCSLKSITLADGRVIGRNDNVAGATVTTATAFERVDQGEISRPYAHETGQPNISGAWLTLSFGPGSKGGEAPPPDQGEPIWGGYELTELGLEKAREYDVRYDDPALNCHPINIIQGWNHDINVNEVSQYDDKIVLQYGFVDFVRTIYLNMDQHPDDLEPSVGGHSIGRWVDDVLVVDTIGFEEGVLLHQGGVRHSENLHVTERFYRDRETNELVRNYTLSDPDYFVGLHEGVDYMEMSSAPYSPFNCVELSGANNQRSDTE